MASVDSYGYDDVMTLSYLDELDRLLLDQSDECLLLSQLDGFLTGVLICPELIPPSRWLPRIWSGEPGEGQPDFADMTTFQRVIDLVMHHYNTILSDLNRPGTYEPLLDIDTRNGDVLWEMWIEGFAEALDVAPAAWRNVAHCGDAGCEAAMKGFHTLRALAKDERQFGEAKQIKWHRQAPDLIPIWVEILHAWRLENDPKRPVRSSKVGRNEPCPCGSGKKYKKCCGVH